MTNVIDYKGTFGKLQVTQIFTFLKGIVTFVLYTRVQTRSALCRLAGLLHPIIQSRPADSRNINIGKTSASNSSLFIIKLSILGILDEISFVNTKVIQAWKRIEAATLHYR